MSQEWSKDTSTNSRSNVTQKKTPKYGRVPQQIKENGPTKREYEGRK